MDTEFVRISADLIKLNKLADFNPWQHRLFALNDRDIKFYPIEDEKRVFLQLLKQKFFAAGQPFLRLALAKVTNKPHILQRELSICASWLLRTSPEVVDSWFAGQLELLKEHVSNEIYQTLPSDWREFPAIAKMLLGGRGVGANGVSSSSDAEQTTPYGAGAAMARMLVVTGIFKSREGFEYACQSVASLGHSLKEINVLMSDATLSKYFPEISLEEEIPQSGNNGDDWWNQASGFTDQVVDMLATGSAFPLPQYQLFISGPLNNALIIRLEREEAIPSDVVELLIGEGVSENVARQYEHGITAGGIVVTMEPFDKEESGRIADEWLYDEG